MMRRQTAGEMSVEKRRMASYSRKWKGIMALNQAIMFHSAISRY
jgi:hypothetical protein